MKTAELERCLAAFYFRRRANRLLSSLASQMADIDYPCLPEEIIAMATNNSVQSCISLFLSHFCQIIILVVSFFFIGCCSLVISGFLTLFKTLWRLLLALSKSTFQDDFNIPPSCFDIVLQYKPVAFKFCSWIVTSCCEVLFLIFVHHCLA